MDAECLLLKKNGYTIKGGFILKKDILPTEEEYHCIDELCNEWDFCFISKDEFDKLVKRS